MDKVAESIVILLGGILMVIGLAIVLAFPTMWAWNYVMPHLFNFKEITFLHGIALNYLAATLIKSSLSQKK